MNTTHGISTPLPGLPVQSAISPSGASWQSQPIAARVKPELPTTQEAYDKAQAKKNRGEWWKSGLLAFGALGATGLAGIGLDWGLKAIVPTMAATIQTAIGPAWWGIIGAVSGAVTYLFIQKVTEPVGAWVSKWASKGSPIQATNTPEITKEFIEANQGANAADSRALLGAASAASFEGTRQETMRAVREQLERAESLTGRDAAIATQRAASYLGRKLVATEVLNFAVVPDFKKTFELLHLALGATFEGMSAEQQKSFIDATIDVVRNKRPKYADPKIPQIDAAVTSYYRPILESLVTGRMGAV